MIKDKDIPAGLKINAISEGTIENPETFKIQLISKFMSAVFSDKNPEIIECKTGILTEDDVKTWVLTCHLIKSLLVDEFILDEEKRYRCELLIRKIIATPMSIDGRGFDKIMDSLKNQMFTLQNPALKNLNPTLND